MDDRYIANSQAFIDAMRIEIEALEERIVNLKEQSKEAAYNLITKSPDIETRNKLANIVYWQYVGLIDAIVILNSLGVRHFTQTNVLAPYQYTAICKLCNSEYETTASSRTQRQDSFKWNVCPLCTAKAEQENAERRNAYQEREKQYAEYVQTLKSMPYRDYLQTQHWQTLRSRMLKRAEYRCQVCNTNKQSLHVHHRTYKNRGQEEYSDLVVLCADCHETFHANSTLEK